MQVIKYTGVNWQFFEVCLLPEPLRSVSPRKVFLSTENPVREVVEYAISLEFLEWARLGMITDNSRGLAQV